MSEYIISAAEFEARFPFDSLKQVLLYGSMVFSQDDVEKQSSPGNLVDTIFIVSDTDEFHDANFRTNMGDYPFILKLSSGYGLVGPWISKRIQTAGAKTSYFTDVQIAGEHTKYGVIGIDDYISDLENWDTLYMAGRAHKVQHVIPINDADVAARLEQARRSNLEAAVRVGLLMNHAHEEISEIDLIETIVGISYLGDVRSRVGAKGKDKEKKLMRQLEGLTLMYKPILKQWVQEGLLTSREGDDEQIFYSRIISVEELSRLLPQNLALKLEKFTEGEIDARLISAISEINSESSTVQALKGIITAGIWTSLQYAAAKLLKGKLRDSKGESIIKTIFRL
ncbi:hypothetical protein KC909_04000 [Candidatus Dojkabacteria bacterium]|uniref:Phosphatidate cytidylyltransferase n=1 Tax=Candidatus Dojkabacteria bacterium TaxID=2099670 RepID=A0A955RJ78_9BACT|nr:hypothetical protein [Candidatus Dojkabacteria bacterium]